MELVDKIISKENLRKLLQNVYEKGQQSENISVFEFVNEIELEIMANSNSMKGEEDETYF
ncbi:hypothetical protein [Bacillus sp. V2I10]|uniref:hypothetical protein n=1 Tax=Bacillus sp. V2I10 TaxID=3042276 RepID=UPI00277F8587|nr:hypothetical protein [Bacillus sp. V2I10]MDQ0859281.1 hypothetical protein [Bacillus sp. V2I10]